MRLVPQDGSLLETALEEAEDLKTQFVHFLFSGEYSSKTLEEWCQRTGCSKQTTYRWRRTQEFADMAAKIIGHPAVVALDKRRVLDALKTKALTGDVPAAKLFFELVDNFTTMSEDTSTDSDIDAELGLNPKKETA